MTYTITPYDAPNRFLVNKTLDNHYLVEIGHENECSCEGFYFNRTQECCHIRLVKLHLAAQKVVDSPSPK